MWVKDTAHEGHSASICPLPQAPCRQNHQFTLFASVMFYRFLLSSGFLFWVLDEIREIKEDESELSEGLTSQQIFLWLQGLFLFALVWTVAGTINTNSRKKFDLFFRNLIMGMDDNNPRPRSVKLTRNNIFPEKGNLLLGFLPYYNCLILCSKLNKNVWTKSGLYKSQGRFIACLGGFASSSWLMYAEMGGLQVGSYGVF